MWEEHLVVLLIRLGVVAALASILVRSDAIKRMLLREQRTLTQRLVLSAGFASIFGTGVAIRVVTRGYAAVDLGLEGSLLAGLLGGYVTGLVSGVLISLPAAFGGGEYLALPLLAGVGALGGLLRDCAPDPEEIWRFSPGFDLSIYHFFRRRQGRYRAAFQIIFLGAVVGAEFLRLNLGHLFPRLLFSLNPGWPDPHPMNLAGGYVTALFTVMLPLKIWNNTRNEKKLEEQNRLLMQARLDALSKQINPHFLFNTLNSVSSLIRTNPAQARAVVYKLSNIMRRLLRKHDTFNSLGEEMEFINDYLSIEMVRFGEKLRFEKDIDPATVDRLVPSMLLQPLVENSIRHGLSSKVEGGMIRLRSSIRDGRLRLLVEDDGVGIPEARLATLLEEGIGLGNVNERLKVLFGGDYRIRIDSQPGHGTRIELELPEVHTTAPPAA